MEEFWLEKGEMDETGRKTKFKGSLALGSVVAKTFLMCADSDKFF